MASASDSTNQIVQVNEGTVKRLVRDIVSIHKNPLVDQGIYYHHDDENMLVGYAMIIGPTDTCYEDGFFFFKFLFPEDYPLSPPKVMYMTNNGKTRFHPNLYRNGKTCLSILNTWRGESWTSCQTIRSVLLTLVSILDDNPLLNEPGITEKMNDVIPYKKTIAFRTLEYAHLHMLKQSQVPFELISFYPYIKEYCEQNKERIIKRCKELAKDKKETYYIRIYNMKCIVNYKKLYKNLIQEYNTMFPTQYEGEGDSSNDTIYDEP